MEFAMIRPIAPNETTVAIALAAATGLFQPHETEELARMLSEHFGGETDSQDLWLTDDDDGLVGIAYVAPERMTEGTWNLYLIGIHPDRQRQGRGAALLGGNAEFGQNSTLRLKATSCMACKEPS
jgi:GNAT superfamily N-acetyltransferase